MISSPSASESSTLFKYVKDSKAITKYQAIVSSKAGQDKISQLKRAVESANYDDNIFEDSHCQLYIEALLKTNEINNLQHLTLLLYISALQSFTTKQPLPIKQSHLKQLTTVDVLKLSEAKDEYVRDKYFNHVLKNAEVVEGGQERVTSLKPKFLSLPLSEQSLLVISAKKNKSTGFFTEYQGSKSKKTDLDFIQGLGQLSRVICCDNELGLIIIPSMSIFKALLEAINPEITINMCAVFGSLKPTTMFNEFHQHGRRLVNLFSTLVRSNPSTVHGLLATPFGAAFHDLSHIELTSNSLNKEQLQNNIDILKLSIEIINFIELLEKNDYSSKIYKNIMYSCFENFNDLTASDAYINMEITQAIETLLQQDYSSADLALMLSFYIATGLTIVSDQTKSKWCKNEAIQQFLINLPKQTKWQDRCAKDWTKEDFFELFSHVLLHVEKSELCKSLTTGALSGMRTLLPVSSNQSILSLLLKESPIKELKFI
jgi:hypothetical protein